MLAVQMKAQAFNAKKPISAINSLTESNRACDSLRTHEGAVVLLFRDFMSGASIVAIRKRFTRPQTKIISTRGPLHNMQWF